MEPTQTASKPDDATSAWLASRRNASTSTAPVAAPSAPVAAQREAVPVVEDNGDVDPQVAGLAREICKTQGRDSELLVSYTVPEIIGTPEGNVYLIPAPALVPMWNCYIAVARATLKTQADAKPVKA